MSKHLRLLETLRQSSSGLKEIAAVIDQAVVDIQKIEASKSLSESDSEVILSELGETISKIQKDKEAVDGSITELPKPTDFEEGR